MSPLYETGTLADSRSFAARVSRAQHVEIAETLSLTQFGLLQLQGTNLRCPWLGCFDPHGRR